MSISVNLFCTETVIENDKLDSGYDETDEHSKYTSDESNDSWTKTIGDHNTTYHPPKSYMTIDRCHQSPPQPPPNTAAYPTVRINIAREDPSLLSDRCLINLLKAQNRHHIDSTTIFDKQTDVTPSMRHVVVEWMMEVCEENKCQEEVFLLALNYFDRFLAVELVQRIYLQTLAAACLLLASKLREPNCQGLGAELLVFYTDNSITRTDLISWELCVLSKLKWDISSVTPLDFLEFLLKRLQVNEKCSYISSNKIRQHAQAFVSLAVRDHRFSKFSASAIAASSVAASLIGMHWHTRSNISKCRLLYDLTIITDVKLTHLTFGIDTLELIYEEQRQKIEPYLINVKAKTISSSDDDDVDEGISIDSNSIDSPSTDLTIETRSVADGKNIDLY